MGCQAFRPSRENSTYAVIAPKTFLLWPAIPEAGRGVTELHRKNRGWLSWHFPGSQKKAWKQKFRLHLQLLYRFTQTPITAISKCSSQFIERSISEHKWKHTQSKKRVNGNSWSSYLLHRWSNFNFTGGSLTYVIKNVTVISPASIPKW